MLNYRISLSGFAILVLVTLACAGGASVPTVTPMLPTETLLPTHTATAEPTATPDRTATAMAKLEADEAVVLEELDKLLGDTEIPYQDGKLAWVQDEQLKIRLLGPEGEFFPFAEDVVGKNFILKSDVTWSSTGILLCGLIFRSEPDLKDGKQYRFFYVRFSGVPAWSIDVYEFDQFQNTPTKVQYSSAINQDNNRTNQIVLVAQAGEFNVYINGVRQGRYFDYSEQRQDGGFGLVALQDFGEGSCVYDNTWVWELE
jgi:hypothetical protein